MSLSVNVVELNKKIVVKTWGNPQILWCVQFPFLRPRLYTYRKIFKWYESVFKPFDYLLGFQVIQMNYFEMITISTLTYE